MKKRILTALCIFAVLASVGFSCFGLWESGMFIFEQTADVSLNRVVLNGNYITDASFPKNTMRYSQSILIDRNDNTEVYL